jgi:hypothetical protein
MSQLAGLPVRTIGLTRTVNGESDEVTPQIVCVTRFTLVVMSTRALSS